MVAVHALVPAADVWRAAAAARGRRRVVDPARPGRADDSRERRRRRSSRTSARAATRRCASGRCELDGAEPARAVPGGDLPERGAARARRPRAPLARAAAPARRARSRSSPASSSSGAGCRSRSVGIYVPRNLLSTLVMCAVPAQVAGVERIVVVTPPAGAGACRRRGRGCSGSTRSGRSAARRRSPALAYGTETIARRQDRRARQRVRERGEAARRARRRDRPARPARPRSSSSPTRRSTGGSSSSSSRRRQEHGPDSVCRVRADGDLEAALARSRTLAPEHLVLLGEAEPLAPRSATRARSSSAPSSPVAAGDYATGGNHVLPTGGWARSVGGLGLETFLKPVTIQRLTARGLARAATRRRGARRRRGHARARRGGPSMRALRAEFTATRGRPRRRSSRGSPGSIPSRSCASTETSPPPPLPSSRARRDRRRARARQHLRARRLPGAAARDRRLRRRRAREHRARRGRRRPDPALRARVRRARRHASRSRTSRPTRSTASPRASRAPRSATTTRCSRSAAARTTRRRARAAARCAAARRRRGVLRVRGRDRGRPDRRRRDRAADVLEGVRPRRRARRLRARGRRHRRRAEPPPGAAAGLDALRGARACGACRRRPMSAPVVEERERLARAARARARAARVAHELPLRARSTTGRDRARRCSARGSSSASSRRRSASTCATARTTTCSSRRSPARSTGRRRSRRRGGRRDAARARDRRDAAHASGSRSTAPDASASPTGAGLYDHLLEQLAFHGGLDLVLEGVGDLETGDHHTAEDAAISLGQALDRALGDRRGIARYGDAVVPMDDALARAAVDLGGRPWAELQLELDPGHGRPHAAEPRAGGAHGDPRRGERPRRAPLRRGRVQGGRPRAAGRGSRRERRAPVDEGRAVKRVAVCDYGAGNTRSVVIAFRRLGAVARSTTTRTRASADLAVLPGRRLGRLGDGGAARARARRGAARARRGGPADARHLPRPAARARGERGGRRRRRGSASCRAARSGCARDACRGWAGPVERSARRSTSPRLRGRDPGRDRDRRRASSPRPSAARSSACSSIPRRAAPRARASWSDASPAPDPVPRRRGGRVVKGVKFQGLRDVGDPVELGGGVLGRRRRRARLPRRQGDARGARTARELVGRVADAVSIPFTVGGGVRSAADAEALLAAGADKVSVNSAALARPSSSPSWRSCSARRRSSSRSTRRRRGASRAPATTRPARRTVDWAREAQERGAGEILLTSIDADGTRAGYDLEITAAVADAVTIPVIASGGAGSARGRGRGARGRPGGAARVDPARVAAAARAAARRAARAGGAAP